MDLATLTYDRAVPTPPVKAHVTRVRDIVGEEDRRVRRRSISRPLIVATALELVDAGGPRGCTMQALAARLEVTPRARSRHVANKDDLLRGVAHLVLSDMALPDPARPWRERLRHAGFELRRVLRAHPRAAVLCAAQRSTVFPAVIPVADAVIRVFRELGLPDEAGVRFAHALGNYAHGYAMAENDWYLRPDEPPVVDPLGGIDPALVPLAAANTAFFVRFANDGLFASDEQFAFGLDLLIDGVAARRDPREDRRTR